MVVPAVQAVHAVAPFAALYDPSAQMGQVAVVPVPDLYEPAVHWLTSQVSVWL
jgi:hypothetical protein